MVLLSVIAAGDLLVVAAFVLVGLLAVQILGPAAGHSMVRALLVMPVVTVPVVCAARQHLLAP